LLKIILSKSRVKMDLPQNAIDMTSEQIKSCIEYLFNEKSLDELREHQYIISLQMKEVYKTTKDKTKDNTVMNNLLIKQNIVDNAIMRFVN